MSNSKIIKIILKNEKVVKKKNIIQKLSCTLKDHKTILEKHSKIILIKNMEFL